MSNKRKVIVKLQGGLGNQLFQYAAAYAAAKERNAELILDPTTGFTNDPYRRSFRLSYFTLSGKIADAKDMQSRGAMPSMVSGLYRKTEWILCTRFGIYYLPRLLRPQFGSPLIMDGYYQSYRYFSAFREALSAELQVKPEVISKTAERWRKIIANEDAIAVHVRRNNYANKCSAGYYASAVHKLSSERPGAKVFIFADDHRWVADNLLPVFDGSLVQIEGETSDLQEFWLMTQCQHFIIANSTFSWWAAWLGSHAEKGVIAPRDGWCSRTSSIKGLLPAEWETM